MRRAIVYLRERRSDMMPSDRSPNKRGAGDGGIPSQLHTGRRWAAAPDHGR